ncbi:MAG: TonB family protein [Polyangiales bacterium]
MFCPACGVENAENARFCNQCGARIASMQPVTGGTQPGHPTPAPTPTPSRGSAHGDARDPAAYGTGDRIEVPMVGPSRRAVAIAVTTVGLACGAIGAVIAWRAVPHPEPAPPVTPVGLLGDPSPPPSVDDDAGAASEALPPIPPPPRAGTRTASRGGAPANAHAPSAPNTPNTPNTPSAPSTGSTASAGSANTAPSAGGNGTAPSTGSTASAGSSGAASRDAGTTVAANTPPPPLPAENGVRERGPRTSAGGYHMGDETDATGTMDPHAFSYVYNHYRSQIAACHSTASRASSVNGVMVVRVRVGEGGHVTRTRVISDSTHSPQLATCVQNAIRGWRYPEPEGGDVEVDYPLRFGGGG